MPPEVTVKKAWPQNQQEIATDQERRKLFLRYLNRGWLIFGIVTLASIPFFPAQRSQCIYLAAIIFPTYLLVRFLNLSDRTRLAGVVFTLAVNFGFYGLFLFLVRELGAREAFQTQATVWQLMGLAVLFAGALVDKWAAPGVALFDTVLLIGTQQALAPESEPRPSAVIFWWMMAAIIWLYESTLQQAMERAWAEVAERKGAEEALRESERRYRLLAENVTDVIWTMDLNLRSTYTSPSVRYMRGYDAQEAMAQPLKEALTPASFEVISQVLEEELAIEKMPDKDLLRARTLELELIRKDGSTVWVETTMTVLRNPDGQPVEILGINRDVTTRKRVEAEITQLNQDLERRVAERTRELAEANARLTELDQLKSRFVSDVSHELRTPIANLKLYIDLLEHGKPEKQTHYVAVLQQQVRRVAALVDDILDLSRLERRKEQGLIYQAVALNDVVDQVVLAHQPRAEADGLLLTFEPVTPLPPVRADANQLAQVVTNLITNALSYTSAGYVRVSTFAKNREVCLCVADSGSGIAPDDLPHVFERFYRGQYVLKNDVPGTGLGLAIAKEIVDLHAGRIEVDSQPGQGSTFRVWLPLAQGV
jgi:PAS domain S-box-containing protein